MKDSGRLRKGVKTDSFSSILWNTFKDLLTDRKNDSYLLTEYKPILFSQSPIRC